jgi:hypothetical protein
MHDAQTDKELFRSRQFPKLTLGALFFFGAYAQRTQQFFNAEGKSFRAFVKEEDRSHRVLVKIVDRLEAQMQRLVIDRTYRGPDGSMYRVADYAETKVVRSKRNGTLTNYGRAWWQMAQHIGDLYDMMIHVQDDQALINAIREHRELLSGQRMDMENTVRPKEDFDGL